MPFLKNGCLDKNVVVKLSKIVSLFSIKNCSKPCSLIYFVIGFLKDSAKSAFISLT